MSGSRAGRARLDSKGLSSFKIAIASLDRGFVLQNWQLSYSVHMTQVVADCASSRRLFYALHQKVISHQLRRSSSPKRERFAGLHFGFLFLQIDP